MFGSSILEVAIGLVLVYLLLSLICSAIQESLEGWSKIRASHLEKGLRELLQDRDGTQLLRHLYDHPLIYGLFRGEYDPARVRSRMTTNLPTYIPPANFAIALIDTLVRGPVSDPEKKGPPPSGELSIDTLRAAIDNNSSLNAPVRRLLLLSLDSAQGDLARAQANIEAWFNSGMERVSGWYKRRMQAILLGLGLAVAVLLNVDSMKLATELYHNDVLRAAVVAQAGAVSKNEATLSADAASIETSLKSLNLPIGWKEGDEPWYEELKNAAPASFVGWLLTAIAISFGAPFWFDLLNKLIVLRSTMKPQDKGPKDGSQAPRSQDNRGANLQGATGFAAASPNPAALPAAMGESAFKGHEWAAGDDPQGGVL
jgi:hypothetical protein